MSRLSTAAITTTAETSLTVMLSILMLTDQQLRASPVLRSENRCQNADQHPASASSHAGNTGRVNSPWSYQFVLDARSLTASRQRHLAFVWMMQVLNVLDIGERFTVMIRHLPGQRHTSQLFAKPVAVTVDSLLRARWWLQRWARDPADFSSAASEPPTCCQPHAHSACSASLSAMVVTIAGHQQGIVETPSAVGRSSTDNVSQPTVSSPSSVTG